MVFISSEPLAKSSMSFQIFWCFLKWHYTIYFLSLWLSLINTIISAFLLTPSSYKPKNFLNMLLFERFVICIRKLGACADTEFVVTWLHDMLASALKELGKFPSTPGWWSPGTFCASENTGHWLCHRYYWFVSPAR